jgi:hypothetical protein
MAPSLSNKAQRKTHWRVQHLPQAAPMVLGETLPPEYNSACRATSRLGILAGFAKPAVVVTTPLFQLDGNCPPSSAVTTPH